MWTQLLLEWGHSSGSGSASELRDKGRFFLSERGFTLEEEAFLSQMSVRQRLHPEYRRSGTGDAFFVCSCCLNVEQQKKTKQGISKT